MRLTSDHKFSLVRSSIAAVLALALLSVGVSGALAATEVRGEERNLQIEAKNASIREILDSLATKYPLTYKLPPNLNRVVTGRYAGSLAQVLRRVLDGNDFIIKASDNLVEVVVFGSSQATAVVAAELPSAPKPPTLPAGGFPSTPPPLNSYLPGNGASANVGGSP